VYQTAGQPPIETGLKAVPPNPEPFSCSIDLADFPPGVHTVEVWFKDTARGLVSPKTSITFGMEAPTGLRQVP
jgi:hypothetical protein